MSVPDDYDALLDRAEALYPGVRVGRPGRARTYWGTISAMRLLRLRYDVDLRGTEHVERGRPAILVGNHTNALDPVVVVMSAWWRVTAFTKVEVFQRRGSVFFRLMGQIPLRRGDAASTEWAMAMASQALRSGGMLGLYPEGTRSPDPDVLHRLHPRVLIPLIEANPDVPVHAVATRFLGTSGPRQTVQVRVSPPLELDLATMGPDGVIAVIRDALLELGGQRYSDRSAREAKAELRAARKLASER